MVRQVENLASNRENFNYLNGNHNQGGADTDLGDGYAEIEINKQEDASKTQDVTKSDNKAEKKVIENLI